MKALLEKIRKILRSRRTRQMMTRFVSGIAAVVVFVTTYALVLPAITLEQNASCGIPEHQHTDACYEERLVCGLPEGQEHHHDASCYDKILICGQEVHVHSPECYQEDSSAVVSSGSAAAASTAFGAAVEPDVLYGTGGSEYEDDALVTDGYAAGEDAGEEGIEETDKTAAEKSVAEEPASNQAVGESGTDNTAADGLNSGEPDAGEAAPEGSAQDDSDSGTADPEGLKDSEDRNSEENKTADTSDSNEAVNGSASDTSDAENEDAAAAGTEEAANAATTNVLPEPVETESLSSGYVPELDSIELGSVLNKHTDFYYFHPEQGQGIPATSAEVTNWKKVKNGLFGSTELKSTDLVKMYLSYTIPAGALNETNQVVRYRLPSNIHLTDEQIIAINETENGMSALYADAASGNGNGEPDQEENEHENAAGYQKYLGVEAIEGSRTPDDNLKEGEQEYISAIIKAENVFDDEGIYGEKGAFLGQDLIFVFTPYSIEKNQITYNADGDPLSAGEKITGWFACDFNMNQIDWVEQDTDLDNSTVEKSAEVVFVEKDSEKNIKEISRTLKLVDGPEDESDSAAGETADEAQTAASDETAAAAETASAADTSAVAETAGTADTASEKAFEDKATGAEDKEDAEDGSFKAGTLTADGDGYKITLDYTEKAEIPENAELSVREITAETDKEAYETCLEQAGQQVAADEKTGVDRKASRFFDIEILVRNKDREGKEETRKIEPAAPVSVNIQIIDDQAAEDSGSEDSGPEDKKSGQSEPAVLHFAEEGVEQIDAEVKDSQEQKGDEDKDSGEESEPSGAATEISFEAESFSVYGVVYTVDFYWEVDGKTYDFSIPGGGFVSFYKLIEILGIEVNDSNTQKDEIQELVEGVESITFSNPELVSVSKVKEDTTVGAIKDGLGLECQYSGELTKEEIREINMQEAKAGDWALISLKAFDTKESLTVTMKNGESFTIRVTDAQVTSLDNIDENKSYVIYTQSNGGLYVLKTDGSTEIAQRSDLDGMDNNYKWKFDYVYTDANTGISYYVIRPCDDNTKYMYLSYNTTFPWSNPNDVPLVQQGSGNVMVIPNGNGTFRFEGYNNTKLVLDNGWFAGRIGNSYNNIVIYEQGQISQYRYTVTTDDFAMGKVCGWNDQGQYKEDAEFDAITNSGKTNQAAITAQPQTARYIFDYWDLNGTTLDYGATIPANSLTIPYQGSRLTAHFKKDPNYVAPDDEKEGRVIDKESFQKWLQELRDRNIPLNQDGCTKTAELYDYENRIYRVDLTAQSNLSMFDGDIDLGFIIDVSGSMQFPSKLIPVSGMESIDVGHINDNYYTQHQLDTNKVYYIVVDRTNTANVLRLKWCGGTNPAYSNRTGWPTGNPNSSSTTWHTGWGICGLGYEEGVLDGATRYFSDTTNALFAGDNGPFQIYEAGDNGKRRREYLESSIAGTITELRNILGDLAYAQNAGEAADVKVAYNTFADAVDYDHTNHNFVSVTNGLSISYDYKGGTDTEEALIDADAFFWNDSATKVAVLITDGAPQQAGVDGPTLDARVKAAADTLKNQGIKLVTVGLSMGDVKRGSRLLYDIATKDSDGDPYFYRADTGDELQYALYEVIQQVMADAIVVGNVTDTVNEAFYPVDKNTGASLEVRNVIDLQGIKIADRESELSDEQKAAGYGVIGMDDNGNYTVTWNGQNFTWDGWHGIVYEKAKEDFLGGNAVRTNDPDKPATIVSEGYKIHPEDSMIAFKQEITEQGTKSLETPRVNVNELDLTDNGTEWTVYLGTEVDPKSQLEAFYDSILVKEVVTAAEDVDEDGYPDRMTGTSLYYPLLESISDERESSGTGKKVTFKMKDLLKKLNGGDDITIDDLIAAGEGGITVPYDLYGQDCPGTINIRLKKTGETSDYDPHATTVTGDAVEIYDLQVDFAPDYVHLPEGQGGDDSKPYHTGEYSLAYPGHAAGEDYSTNNHVINVYNVPLDVYKTDENNEALPGATFKLYKVDDQNGDEIEGMEKAHKYVEVASGTSGDDGIARLKSDGQPFGLVQGETYYLVESSAPQTYLKTNTVWTVQVQTEIGAFTGMDGQPVYSTTFPIDEEHGIVTADMYPFNWDQGARIVLDGSQPVTVIAKGEEEGQTEEITDGLFVSHKKAISFRHTVQNLGGEIDINVNKTWEDEDNPPESITVKLYRVSDKKHQWSDGKVVPCTCTTEGVREYTCSVCGQKDTHVITATDHKAGPEHRENETKATCTENGGYDTVVRCTVCNAVIRSTHTDIPAPGHSWVNREVVTTDPEQYCYDTVNICSVCGAKDEGSRVHHEHDWDEWVVTTPTQINVAGERIRTCRHNNTHTQTEILDPLPAEVTVYFRCTGNGTGGLDYYGQITDIATRSGTGNGDMTIQWNWNSSTLEQPFIVSGLEGGASYTSSWQRVGNSDYGGRQTLTIHNITKNLIIYVTIRNYNWAGTDSSLIYQPTFAGIQGRSAAPSAARMLRSSSASPVKSSADSPEMGLQAGKAPARSGETTRDGEGEGAAGSSMTHEQLVEYLNSLVSESEATCEETDGAIHTYKEEVDTYTITPDDHGNWSLPIDDLPKYNEYGDQYKYYIVETSSTYGYDVTYSGQDSGMQDGSSTTINNKKLFGSLNITKTIKVAGGHAEQEAFPSGTYSYPVHITTVIRGTTYYVQDVNGTLATTPPETPLTVTAGEVNSEGAPLTINHLPYGTYTVSEIQPDSVEVSGYSFVVQETGAQGEIHFQSTTSGEGTVDETAGEVDLINYYMRGASWTPEADKQLNGLLHTEGAAGYSGYTFTLAEPAGQNTIHGQQGQPQTHTLTAVTDEGGKAVFERIEYHLRGNQQSAQYSYTITENRPAGAQDDPYISDDIQYDTKTIYVLVTVNKTGNGPNIVTEAHANYYSDEAHTQPLTAVAFDNTELASLDVAKIVSGAYTPTENDSFPITIRKGDLYLNSNGELVEEDPQLTIKAGQTLSFDHIPVGTYVVTEGDAERAGYSLTTAYSCQVGGQTSETHSIVLGKGDDGSVGITNTYYQVNVTIIKIDEATRENTTPTTLPEAAFKLYKYTIPEGSTTGAYTIYPDAASSEKRTSSSGSLQFTSLPNGKYRIDESEPPAGYVAVKKLEIYFTVENGELTWTNADGNEISSQNLVSYTPEDKTFTVGNFAGAALPHTGGSGTKMFYFLGIMLTGIAGAVLIMRRLRRAK